MRVLEILKSDSRFKVGDLLDVHRHGSVGKDPNFADFEKTDEIVLFLERGRDGRYLPIFGPDGAFKLQHGRAHAYGRNGAVSKRHEGTNSEVFLSEMRKHKK